MIVKTKKGYQVKSEKGKNLSPNPTLANKRPNNASNKSNTLRTRRKNNE